MPPARWRERFSSTSAAARKTCFASLAPLVFEHASADFKAQQLLAAAVQQLEDMVAAVDPGRSLPLCLSGSVAKRLAPQFSAALRARCVPPQGDAMDGALRLLAAPEQDPTRIADGQAHA